jgi:hypothetical protein
MATSSMAIKSKKRSEKLNIKKEWLVFLKSLTSKSLKN